MNPELHQESITQKLDAFELMPPRTVSSNWDSIMAYKLRHLPKSSSWNSNTLFLTGLVLLNGSILLFSYTRNHEKQPVKKIRYEMLSNELLLPTNQ
jgi:hypothetical protein